MDKLKWIIFAVVSVGILTTLVILSQSSKIDVSNIDTATIQEGSDLNGGISDHQLNQATSPVTLIEYGDFQCPGCAGAHPRMKALMEEYGDNIQFVFRNLPLVQIHPNAKAAASAAEAAGLQGKYWEMHDILFDKQNEWGMSNASERTNIFVSYAATLQLDLEKFRADLSSDNIAKKINFDIALAAKDKFTSTPSFMLNGTSLESDIWGDDQALRDLIDTELAKHQSEE
jgi:protein-disulfide isomerase